MKRINSNFLFLLSLLIISITSFSFIPKPGGEGFEIYLDNKLVLQKFGKNLNNVQDLQLSAHNSEAELKVNYHHCGRPGNNRMITIRDASDNKLKEWKFSNSNESFASMSCKVKDILKLKKTGATLKLYYSSDELPNGRQIASIVVSTKGLAARLVSTNQ